MEGGADVRGEGGTTSPSRANQHYSRGKYTGVIVPYYSRYLCHYRHATVFYMDLSLTVMARMLIVDTGS